MSHRVMMCSMSIEIRTIKKKELTAFVSTIELAFAEAPLDELEDRRVVEQSVADARRRGLTAREGGRRDLEGVEPTTHVEDLANVLRPDRATPSLPRDVALAKAYDVVQQIRKTPIVVNDSRGFYTSRVIGFMVNEGLAMLAEGVHPYLVGISEGRGVLDIVRAATDGGTVPR